MESAIMGGYQVPGTGTGDDGFDEEGYDESQRAEILETTRDGPTDGTILTDLLPDTGDKEDEEDLEMSSDDVGEEADEDEVDDKDDDEDDVQARFDDGDDEGDDADGKALNDADDVALKP
ncbi:MAG: DNA primase [Sphingomonas sp.]